jgi:hypothetical protein
LSGTKPGTLLKELIPVRTFADGDEEQAGFLEVDLVPPCTESAEGFYPVRWGLVGTWLALCGILLQRCHDLDNDPSLGICFKHV